MDLQNQQRVKDAAEKFGAENVVVILGSSDAEGAELYAETVTVGQVDYVFTAKNPLWEKLAKRLG